MPCLLVRRVLFSDVWVGSSRRKEHLAGLVPWEAGKAQPGTPALAAASRRRRVEAFVERELLAILRINDGIVQSCAPPLLCTSQP